MKIFDLPSTGSECIATLDAGEEVEVLRIDSVMGQEWAYIRFSALNTMGWLNTNVLDMSNVYLEHSSTNIPYIVDLSPKWVVTATSLNVRSGAGFSYPIVGTLDFGDEVDILETTTAGETTWGRIDAGWVTMDYISRR